MNSSWLSLRASRRHPHRTPPPHGSGVLLRLALVTVALVAVLLGSAAPAWAHNSFVSSDPADGAVLAETPATLSLRFAKDVPLDTVTVLWIDPSGARTPLEPLTHGPAGPIEVLAPVPAGGAGPVTVRWRLVGADGHVVSGRVGLTLPAATTVPAAPAEVVPAAGAGPATTVAAPPEATPEVVTEDGEAGVGGTARWVLRLLSFASITVLGGVVLLAGWLWPEAWRHRAVRVLGAGAGVALAVSSLGLLAVLAADLQGTGLLGGIGSLDAAAAMEAGKPLAARVALALVTLGVLVAWYPGDDRTRWAVLTGLVCLAAGTWALNGHARSMRWSWLGVPVDVVHYVAAVAWLGGLVVVALVAFRLASGEELASVVRRFSGVAAISVAVIVATGMVQAVRLVGGPAGLFGSAHGRILLLKLLVLAAMLGLAALNRRRVHRRPRSGAAAPVARSSLRRAMLAEAGLGLVILAVTAALVVTAPAVSEDRPDPDVAQETVDR